MILRIRRAYIGIVQNGMVVQYSVSVHCMCLFVVPDGADVGRDEGNFLCGVGCNVGKLVGCREGRDDG